MELGKINVDRQTTGKVKVSGDLLEIQSHYPISMNVDDTFSINNCTNIFMNGEWKVTEVKSKYIFYANFSLKKDGEISLAVTYRRENTVKDIFFPAVISFGVMPSARRYHAASVYKNQTNSVSYMIVYVGQSATPCLK